jgi:hypothetical protein
MVINTQHIEHGIKAEDEIIKALGEENKKEFGKRHFSTTLNGDMDQLLETTTSGKSNKSFFDSIEIGAV